MFRTLTFLFVLFLVALTSTAQTTYTWVGGNVGDYQYANNWSPSRTTLATSDILAFNATLPIAVANVPNQTIGAIKILSGTSTITFGTNVVTNVLSLSAATPLVYSTAGSILAGDLLTIALTNTTASFTISTGTFGISPSTGGKISIASDVILTGGTLDFDVVGTGGTTIVAGGSITNTSGTFNCATAAAITWNNTAEYFHNVTGNAASAIPVSTWMGGSVCNVTGMNGGTVAPTGFTGVNFSNVKWDCSSQMGNVDLDFGGIAANFTGTFTIANTGSAALRFSSTASLSLTVGAYTQTGGTLVLQSSSGVNTLTVNNAFFHTGGTIDFVGSGGSGSGILNFRGAVTKAGTSIWSSTSNSTTAQMVLQFSAAASQAVSIGSTWNDPAGGRCNIVNSNTDPVGVSVTSNGVAGSLKVVYVSGALPATCINAGSFTAIGTGSIRYSGNTTLAYSATIPQIASTVEFPAANGPTNLTINNVTGINFPSSFDRWVPGSLAMTAGNLSIGSGSTLTLSNNSLSTQLNYSAGFISSGTLKRYFPATGLPTSAATSNSRFPFGSGANDRSIYLYFSSANLTGGAADSIAITHNAVVNATAIGPFTDNGVSIDKRTNSNWVINTGAFDLGSGGTTISLQAQATNIGSVDNISTLRLTDGAAGFGTLIATTGTTDAPLVGKSNLILPDISSKTFYVGSDNTNALQIVTFTWTGASNSNWANAGNWTGGVGYPTSPTEIAIINTSGGNMPSIGSGTAISVYQLTVTAPASLTITGTGSISVYDNVNFTGTAIFASTSTFTYAASAAAQNIVDLPYGTLAVSGNAAKILPASTTVTGDFIINGTEPTFGTGTFTYAAGAVAVQRVAAPLVAKYWNLNITGNRGGGQIRLGNGVSNNIIDIANDFTVSVTNYVTTGLAYNTINFSSPLEITIPGFAYANITNAAPAGSKRKFDPLGSADPTHVVECRSLGLVTPYVQTDYTTTGSKVKMNRYGVTALFSFNFYDFELAGDLAGATLTIDGMLGIAGTFTVSATNYNLNTTKGRVYYNGTGSQTITPFNYYDLWISGTATGAAAGTRAVTMPNAATIGVRNQLAVTIPGTSSPGTFSSGNGFVVTGSTVNFFTGSNNIPVLPPLVSGDNNYNNITVTGGIRIIAGDLKVGGDVNVIGTDANPAQLTVGNNVSNRTLTILGNLSAAGTTSSSAVTSIIDFNPVNRVVQIKLAGNLSVAGASQLLSGNDPLNLKGSVLFNGTAQQYTNTAVNNNKYVNFIVGDGTNPTSLTLNSNLALTRSGVLPYSDTLKVANNATLNAGTKNIVVGLDTASGTNNAAFNLNAGATLVTANTGVSPNTAIEGSAADGTTGTILSGTSITKNYNTAASYVLNGATSNPFPAAIAVMANLTIGAPVTLNRAIDVNSTLDLAAFTLTQNNKDLEFSGLTSTTGSIAADKNSALSINGTIGTVGTLRFAPGGNTTGQFTINRPVTIPLGSDLTIEKSPLSGNFITGTATSILDINGNTLTINGTVSGTGFLAGSNISNLTLGGTAGTVSFVTGKQVLKNLSLVNSATGTLGTPLDITAGTGPGTEGTVSVTGSAVLTTGGNLTLKSDANGTSRVAIGSAVGGYISGDVTVERYLSSNRSWRFLAAPSYGQTIHQAWQENQPAGVNLSPGIGTNITSNRATWATDGFDFQTPGNSLLIYNPATNAWDGAPNTSSQIAAAGSNKAYMLFLRGDRSVTPAVGAPSTSANIRSKGTLFQGNLPAITVLAGQYGAVGNNYASAIDFNLLTKSNIDQSFTVWDPYIPGAKNLGAWVTFSAATGWLPSIPGGSYTNVANTRIESGQAFMVHNSSAATGSVTFVESSKLSGSKLVSRPLGNGARQMLITNLYNTSTGTANITDGNIAVFSDEYSNSIDSWDAVKINNFGDNFGLSREGKTLVVDARQPVAETDTIFFNMQKVKLQPYRLELIAKDFDASLTGFLEDTYLSTSTVVNMTGTTTYDFSVTSNTASSASNRFRIVFKSTAPLPVTFSVISATEKTNGISVDWKVDNEMNIASYDVERSVNGRDFTKMFNTPARGESSGGTAIYNWLDVKTMPGDNFYRIRSISKDGKTTYSRIVKVTLGKGKTGFMVFPNPVADGMIGLQMSNIPAGKYTVRILNSDGKLVGREMISHPGGNSTQTITSAAQLISGTYQLEIIGEDNKVNILRLLVL